MRRLAIKPVPFRDGAEFTRLAIVDAETGEEIKGVLSVDAKWSKDGIVHVTAEFLAYVEDEK